MCVYKFIILYIQTSLGFSGFNMVWSDMWRMGLKKVFNLNTILILNTNTIMIVEEINLILNNKVNNDL